MADKKKKTSAVIEEVTTEEIPAQPPDESKALEIHTPAEIDLSGKINLTSLSDVQTLAGTFMASGLFKDTEDAAQAVVKILAGQELGLPPVYSMMNFYILRGKIGTQASVFASLIKKSKRYDYRIKEWDTQKCSIMFFEDGEHVLTSTFTMDDAKRAQLVKPDSAWQKYPRDLLFARALTQGARKVCPELVMNIYTREELESITDPEKDKIKPNSPPPPAESGGIKATFSVVKKQEPTEESHGDPFPPGKIIEDAEYSVIPEEEEEIEKSRWQELLETCPLHGEPWKINKWNKRYHFIDNPKKGEDKFCNLQPFLSSEREKLMKSKKINEDKVKTILNSTFGTTSWTKMDESQQAVILAMIENGEYDDIK